MTPAERFLAAEREVDRTACDRYVRSRGVDPDDAAAVQAAKVAYQQQPLLLDPQLRAYCTDALRRARGPAVDGSMPFACTIWYGGATDTRGGIRLPITMAQFVGLLKKRAEEIAEKRRGWVASPITTKTGERKNSNTVAMHAWNGDCDGNGAWDSILAVLTELDFAFIAYQSGGWTPTNPKWHLLLPLARPFTINGEPELCAKWKAAYSTARTALGSIAGLPGNGFDPTVETPCQPVFVCERRSEADPPRVVLWRPGHSLDIEALCAALPQRPEEDRRFCERRRSQSGRSTSDVALASEPAPLTDGRLIEIVTALCAPMSKILSGRRELYLALAGALLDRFIAPDDMYSIIEEVSRRCPGDPTYTDADREQKHREHRHAADTTTKRWEAGEPYMRIGELRERWPTVADAINTVFVDETLKVMVERRAAAAVSPAVPGRAPTQVVDHKTIRRSLSVLRKKKKESSKLDDRIDSVIIGAILDGDDLVPRHISDGTVVLDNEGRPVEWERAVGIAMDSIAFVAPIGTPFETVMEVAVHSLWKTGAAATPMVLLPDLTTFAEAAFIRAVGRKINREQRHHDEAVRRRLERGRR